MSGARSRYMTVVPNGKGANAMNDTTTTNDLGDDLRVRVHPRDRRSGVGTGLWATGTVGGFAFEALVFPAHAANPEWELGTSRISKLHLRRLADGLTAYS